MPLACPGRCRNNTATTTWGEPVWCTPCSRLIRYALRSLPAAYAALDSVRLLTASQPADAVRVSGSRDRPSPAPGVDLRDEIFHTTRSWEDDIRQALNHRAARDGDTREETLHRAVRYLNRNFAAAMARDPGGKEFGQEMDLLLSSALRLVKNGPLRSMLTIPCPACGRKAMMQQEGIALKPWFTACEERLGGCGRTYTEDEMAWMVEVKIAIGR